MGTETLWVQPITFFNADLVNPMSLSQKLPNNGVRFGMTEARHSTEHSTPLLERFSVNAANDSRICSSLAATK